MTESVRGPAIGIETLTFADATVQLGAAPPPPSSDGGKVYLKRTLRPRRR